MEATGAMEELLLLQRPLVDRTLYPLLEAAPEPAFWQLKVVEVIRDVLKKQIGGCVRDAVSAVAASELQDPVEVVSRIKDHMQRSSELAEAMTRLKSDVEAEVVRLTNLLSAGEENYRIEKRDEHFLEQFWEKLQAILEVNEQHPKLDEERDVEAAEDGFESCSFEMLTFDDDLNDVSRSAMR
ncbi:unnamed protein product [Phytophthora lilii]|uniref:Unnamed protein product n=1 Tax=Phytophthora lilii TaxID=2077276 RepID=A0A9W6X177_9STRA|nr:unnamed protein product [Phytophthora lilii]